jgi:hypothetical protein
VTGLLNTLITPKPTATLAFAVSDGLAVTVPLGLLLRYSTGASNSEGIAGIGGDAGLGLKVFLDGNALSDSWYFQPKVLGQFVYLVNTTLTSTEFVQGITSDLRLVGALELGHAWVWENGFTIDLGVGLEYGYTFFTSSTAKHGPHSIAFLGNFGLGYTW